MICIVSNEVWRPISSFPVSNRDIRDAMEVIIRGGTVRNLREGMFHNTMTVDAYDRKLDAYFARRITS